MTAPVPTRPRVIDWSALRPGDLVRVTTLEGALVMDVTSRVESIQHGALYGPQETYIASRLSTVCIILLERPHMPQEPTGEDMGARP